MPKIREIALHHDGEICQVATTTRDCDRSHRWIPLDLAPTPQCDRDGIALSMHVLLSNGWDLFQVWDGEEYVDIFDNDQNAALDAVTAVDDAMLIVRRPAIDHGSGYESGWVRFVLGNDPGEVICDYTTNLREIDKLINTWIQ